MIKPLLENIFFTCRCRLSAFAWLLPKLLLTVTLVMTLSSHAEWVSDTQPIMGTEIRVVAWHNDPLQGEQAIAEVMSQMRRIDQQFSFYKQTSELTRINNTAAQSPVALSAEMYQVLQKALYFGELTSGAFDITFASLGQHYNYREGVAASAEQQQEAIIDYRQIKLDAYAQTVAFGDPRIKIDLGGIVKGYAVDRAKTILLQNAIEHASVSAGGDSYILGDRRGRPWMVGIKNPRQEGVALTVPLDNIAFSTSGDYERFFLDPTSGERIHHIINPSTKRSASDVMSVSVMGPAGFDTDPLSTSVFILGVTRGLELLNRLPQYDGIIIDKNGKVHYSNGLVAPE